MKIIKPSRYWSLHTHSNFSATDALPKVEQIVARAKQLGYPAIGLTDHGNIAGSVQLYQSAQRLGLKPFPGSELYYVPDTDQHKIARATKDGVTASRYHMGVHAFTTQGYENLVRLSTATHKNHFHKPLVDNQMLSEFSENGWLDGLAVSTGCHFGYMVQMLLTHGVGAATRWLNTLQSWFPDAVYVEMQQHEIQHEEHGHDDVWVAHKLMQIALSNGAPLIITQDSHYILPEEREAHETLKRLSSWSDDPDDATFPGDGFHMVNESWMRQHYNDAEFQYGIAGLEHLAARHELEIPVLDKYSYSVPETVQNPAEVMKQRVITFIEDEELPLEYTTKAWEEIEVIEAAGMAAYMMLVAQITDYCRERGWLFQTRGSAAGSVVAWALGITQVDPIHWDLRFERFLSKDRTKPPDIDLDVQHDKRDELIAWLRQHYHVTAIGTWSRLGMEPDENDEGKGSIMRKYYQMQAKKNGPQEWKDVPYEERQQLIALDKQHAYAGMGKNAAGVIITNDPNEVERIVPMAYSPSVEEGVSQYPKNDIEALGLVKLDLLGSKTLTVLARTGDLLGRNMETSLPITRESKHLMGEKSRHVYRDVGKGMTDGVFQLEGWATKKGCQQLKPTSVHDLIAAMALFRPAVMNSGATDAYIERKHGRARAPQRHAIINKITKKTHGIILFQEQVIDLLRELGMEADDLTAFLKAVKASNKDVDSAGEEIARYMPWVKNRCIEEGFTESDWHWLEQALDAFADYSFNRAHSTIYGLTAWRCAYLAHHFPLEFHAALLDVATEGDPKREARYVQAARKRGVKITKPSINVSGASYAVDRDRGVIRKGFNSLKGIGQIAAADLVRARGGRPYSSLDDLVERCEGTKVSGGAEYSKIKRANARKPTNRYYRAEPPTPEDLNGVLKILHDEGVLKELVE